MARTLIGQVVGNQMDKTAVVAVSRLKTHRLYRKKYRVTRKFLVDDPTNSAQVGDRVEIVEVPPISRHKRWRLNKRLSTAERGEA